MAKKDLEAELRRLRALVFFYDTFLKLVLRGLKDLMGDRGASSILKFAARDYGGEVASSMKALGHKSLREALLDLLEKAGTEPEIVEEGENLIIKIRKCPFKRPQEAPLLCYITHGLIGGFVNAFSRAIVEKEMTIADGASECTFKVKLIEG